MIDELTNAFDLLDLEGNGDLEFLEFKLGLQSLTLNLSHEEAIQLFESIDSDNVHTIDREMFSEWLKKEINSSVIEDLRSRIRDAISKQSNLIDDDDDLEREITQIARKQSIKHVSYITFTFTLLFCCFFFLFILIVCVCFCFLFLFLFYFINQRIA